MNTNIQSGLLQEALVAQCLRVTNIAGNVRAFWVLAHRERVSCGSDLEISENHSETLYSCFVPALTVVIDCFVFWCTASYPCFLRRIFSGQVEWARLCPHTDGGIPCAIARCAASLSRGDCGMCRNALICEQVCCQIRYGRRARGVIRALALLARPLA